MMYAPFLLCNIINANQSNDLNFTHKTLKSNKLTQYTDCSKPYKIGSTFPNFMEILGIAIQSAFPKKHLAISEKR